MQVFMHILKKLAFLLPAPNKPASGDGSRWMGKLASAEGQIDWKRADSQHWLPMKPGDSFYPRDAIRAGRDSQAVLLFNCPGYGKYLANLYENSTLTFTPEVLKKYFKHPHYLKDDLNANRADPCTIPETRRS